jgi:lipopolysaccharide export system permease protein
MRLLDRYIVRSFLLNYVLAFAVMCGMYVLLDLIVNFDRFSKGAAMDGESTALIGSMGLDILEYYSYQLLVIFQQVAGAIPLMAAGFTMVRMTRHNELTAMLASGVSLYRVATPIVLVSIVFSGLVIVDQEVLMPACADKLIRKHEEVNRAESKSDPIYFVKDADNSLFMASAYDPAALTLKDVRIIQRDEDGTPIGRIMADSAAWNPNLKDYPGRAGAWQFKNVRHIDDRTGNDPSKKLAERVEATYDYFTNLSPQQLDLIATKKAVDFLASSQIQSLIEASLGPTRASLEKTMHTRFTQPIMNVILLLVGIPFLLTREPRQLVFNMFYCTAATSIIFAATFVLYQAAGTVVPPVLGAWLPV